MKQIKCELCGSIELIKQEGVYVCQHCGAQYSIEEAKKLMIDGVVEVTGKLKLDSSEKLANLYKIARRAKNDDNAENAAKYYDQILIEDPDSWEATFYVVYFKAMQCKIAEIQSAATSVYNCTDTVLNLINDNMNGATEQEEAFSEVVSRITDICTLFYNSATNSYYDHEQRNVQEYLNRALTAINTIYNLGNQLESIFIDRKYACDLAVKSWESGINIHEIISSNIISENHPDTVSVIRFYADKIRKYDPLYREPSYLDSEPKEKFAANYCGMGGFLWVVGREIFFQKHGVLQSEGSNGLMNISDIVSMVKTNSWFGLKRTINITDKNGVSMTLVSWSRDKIIAKIEKHREKLGLAPCINNVSGNTEIPPPSNANNNTETPSIPNNGKSWLTTLLLCLFLGLLGIHRFYTKNIVIGIIQLLTLGGCAIWTIIDFIMILTGKFKDGNGNYLVK